MNWAIWLVMSAIASSSSLSAGRCERLKNSKHSILIEDWKAASGANACLQGQLCAAEHSIPCEIRYPRRFAGLPDGPREAFSWRELESPARRSEGLGVVRRKMADAEAAQAIDRRIYPPEIP